ncbi:NAD-dependent epimerase/dehydratase family protein [Myxococcota bacterium]
MIGLVAMHVLVTGGAGYIGSTLVPVLLDAGHHVRVLDRFFFGDDSLNEAQRRHPSTLQVCRADVRRTNARSFAGIQAVVDLAGISNDPACELDPELTRQVNLAGSLRTAALARTAGVKRLVFASSCSIYGHGHSEQLTESSPLHPVSLYAHCKAEVEKQLLDPSDSSELGITVLRFATVFGLSGRTRFDLAVNVMTKNAYVARRLTVEGGGRQWRPFVHVRDVANCIAQVLEAPRPTVAGRVFNVGSNAGNARIIHLAYRVRDHVPGTEIVMAPTDPDLRDYHVSFDRIARELDFAPQHSLDDGIEEILAALRDGKLDPDDRRGYTLRQYLFLGEVERTYRALALEGRLLSENPE